jgi:hypothetical protein
MAGADPCWGRAFRRSPIPNRPLRTAHVFRQGVVPEYGPAKWSFHLSKSSWNRRASSIAIRFAAVKNRPVSGLGCVGGGSENLADARFHRITLPACFVRQIAAPDPMLRVLDPSPRSLNLVYRRQDSIVRDHAVRSIPTSELEHSPEDIIRQGIED